MIGIIDYGLGNIKAFENIYRRHGIPVRVLQSSDDFGAETERYILPGVGSFDWAMRLLDQSGIRPKLEQKVLMEGCPVLGVCVGLQLLFERSEEGTAPGLGWIKGQSRKLQIQDGAETLRLPHMGWNTIYCKEKEPLFAGLGPDPDFYFLHTYAVTPESDSDSKAVADYHGEFTAAVRCGNIMGTQFHPEKSHGNGLRVLENFASLTL